MKTNWKMKTTSKINNPTHFTFFYIQPIFLIFFLFAHSKFFLLFLYPIYSPKYLKIPIFAKLSFNFDYNFSWKLRLALLSYSPTTHPTTHPPNRKSKRKANITDLLARSRKTSPPSAPVAAMRSLLQQNWRKKTYWKILETPLKLFLKFS